MAIEQCSNCKFYECNETNDYEILGVNYQKTYGICRRYPPKRIDSNNSGFPLVEEEWWCGEHMIESAFTVK